MLMSVHLGGLQYGEEGLKASANGGGPGRGPGGGGGGGGGAGGFHFQVLIQALEGQGDFHSTRVVLCIVVSITYHFCGLAVDVSLLPHREEVGEQYITT